MQNFQNELQTLGMDNFQVGQLIPMVPQTHDPRIFVGMRCGGMMGFGGMMCGGMMCGGMICGGMMCGGMMCGGMMGFGFIQLVVLAILEVEKSR